MDDPKLEIVSVPVAPGQMIGGNIYPDQYVNLYIRQPAEKEDNGLFSEKTFESAASSEKYKTVRLSNLKVSAVLDGNGNDIYASDNKPTGKSRTEILILAVRPDQTQTIVEAAASSGDETSGTSIWVTIANSK